MEFGVSMAGRLAVAEIRYPHLDPVALDLPGPLDVRWYGLAFLFGFAVTLLIVRRLARRGALPMEPDAAGDLLTALVVGVILGGRLGYILFYDFADFARNPARIIRIWEGGLAFHGGLIGALLGAWFFVRTHPPVRFLNLGDALALSIPFGIVAVRLANFINGELYGRIASRSVPWAMRFPTDPAALEWIGGTAGLRAREQAIEAAYQSGLWDQIRPSVPLRHPSQLYQALGEGLLVGLVVWGVYLWAQRTGRRINEGLLGGLWLLGYGLARVPMELFRQPDSQFTDAADPVGYVLGSLTMGQVLSSLMIVAGTALTVWAIRRDPPPAPSSTVPEPGRPTPGRSPAAARRR